jgi:hypothetical protein
MSCQLFASPAAGTSRRSSVRLEAAVRRSPDSTTKRLELGESAERSEIVVLGQNRLVPPTARVAGGLEGSQCGLRLVE